MKAYTLKAINQLVYEDIPNPTCPEGWAIVQVKAAGICSSDVPRVFEKGTYHFPTIPGHEFSGRVTKVGSIEHNFLLGKKVGVFPLIPCRHCSSCMQGKYEMCEHYDYIGSRRDGGFAEYVAVPVWNIMEVPESISFTEAALMEPLAVSLHAVKQLLIHKAEHIAIIGTGMIGFAAAQWALKLGGKSVVIVGRSEQKRELAKEIKGIQYCRLEECTQKFECVLEAVGSNKSLETAIQLTKAGGRIVLMGNPEGEMVLSQQMYWKILRKQLVLAGTWNSSYEKEAPCDWHEVCVALATKQLQIAPLISHVFQQEQLLNALDLMRNHQQPYCKIITLWNKEKCI